MAVARAETLIAELDIDGGDDKAGEAGFRRAKERLERAAAGWPSWSRSRKCSRWRTSSWRRIEERHPSRQTEAWARAARDVDPGTLDVRRAIAYESRGLLERARASAGPRDGARR